MPKSTRMRVTNIIINNKRPTNCMQFFGLLSPVVGTPANRLLASGLASTNKSSKPPASDKFLKESSNQRDNHKQYN